MTRTTKGLLQVAKDLKILDPEWHKPPFRTVRTRAGYWMLANGAWKVMLMDREFHVVFGSQWSGAEVIAAHKMGNTHAYCPSRHFDIYSDIDVDCDYDKVAGKFPRELKRD